MALPASRSRRRPEPLSRSRVGFVLCVWLAAASPAGAQVSPFENPVVDSDEDLAVQLADAAYTLERVRGIEAAAERDPLLAYLVTSLNTTAQLFLDFAHPASPGELLRVDLRTSNDPAVVKLRDAVGLPAPRGWVFVRWFEAAQAPPLVARALADEGTAGVTLFYRYVAIPREAVSLSRDKVEWQQHYARTLSHELVHAYLNCTLGEDKARLPKWFHEAAAIYLSGGNVRMLKSIEQGETGAVWTYVEPSEEYRAYEAVFAFLEDRQGASAVDAFIRQAVTRTDVEAAAVELGYASLDDFLGQVGSWEAERRRRAQSSEQRDRWVVIAISVLAIFAFVFKLLWDRHHSFFM